MPPSHESQPPQSVRARCWQAAKIVGTILLKWIRIVRDWIRVGLEVSAILGIVGFYYQFSPNLSVTPHAGFAGADPFRIPFVISNNSYLAFTNLKTTCLLSNVRYSDDTRIDDSQTDLHEGEAEIVSAGESLTVRCEVENLVIGPIHDLVSADIKIYVSFEVFPYRYMRHEERTFRFFAAKVDNTHWFWLPDPIGKPKMNAEKKSK